MRFVSDSQNIASDISSKGLKILAAGQWRCATSSLQSAFEGHLNPPLGPSMHGAYIMPSLDRMKLCCAACRETDTDKRRALLRRLFDGYNSSSDFPGMAFVDDLLEMYPDVQVVLNKRESAPAWEHSVRDSLKFFSTWNYLALTWWVPQSYWHHQLYRAYIDLCRRRFGVGDVFTQELYNKHNEWVRDVAKMFGKDVVEWTPSMGWSPLCNLTGREEPQEDFPKVNEGQAIKNLTRFLIIRGLIAWAVALSELALLLLALYWGTTHR